MLFDTYKLIPNFLHCFLPKSISDVTKLVDILLEKKD